MSDSDPVITAENLSKAYRIWETPAARLKSPLLAGAASVFPKKSAPHRALHARAARGWRDFHALHDMSFTLRRGEAIGIIGRNGSGKSTLLQIIAGTLTPTTGHVKLRGRVGALLELGSGFNPDFTGRENVFLSGAIYGLGRREMETLFDSIASFADIGDFIEQPVKTYSSGMLMRLAFAVQSAVDPQLLIVDEALSVGDIFFQQKCAARMRELQERGTTMLLVSHDMGVIRNMCAKAIYLRHGRCVAFGLCEDVIRQYHNEAAGGAPVGETKEAVYLAQAKTGSEDELARLLRSAIWTHPQGNPAEPVSIVAVAVYNEKNEPTTSALIGDTLVVEFAFRTSAECPVHVSLGIKNRYDQMVSSVGSYTLNHPPVRVSKNTTMIVRVEFEARLEAGEYTIRANMGRFDGLPNRGANLASTPWLGPITLKWDYGNKKAPFLGMFGLPAKIAIQSVATHSSPHQE
ncbi:MAG TPA: ABC transporter ATP-binding protein [Opitutaceae bacterium]|jgi:lipopolysaccharide transport system ATP-binding protein|nr:ABC transporter ATP-binding protein [Opitutaceae bacterium]